MKRTRLLLAALFGLASASALNGQTVTQSAGTTYTTNGAINDNVTVNQMAGLSLTAYWGSSSQTMSLTNLGGGNWGWSGTGFGLQANGSTDTFFAFWSLQNTRQASLTRLVFDGGPTNLLFDRGTGLSQGTAGSNVGRDLEACGDLFSFIITFCTSGDEWNSQVLYTNQVALNPNSPVGDLYRTVDITFNNGGIAAGRGVDAFFRLDTDVSASAVVTPEPSTYALVATGLLGVVGMARRRRDA